MQQFDPSLEVTRHYLEGEVVLRLRVTGFRGLGQRLRRQVLLPFALELL
ncbi:MAG TPA: hypothetical protein VIH18_17730 [Candidatus Binatia bacterium]|jgi:hypothetical protein